MKISHVSDLHLEFSDITLKNEDNADILILAGDILVAANLSEYHPDWMSHRTEKLYEFFFNVCKEFKNVIYVMGNHESYHSDITITFECLNKYLNKQLFPNLHILENMFVDIDNVRFIGGTLWSDMNDNDMKTKLYIQRRMSDFQVIRNIDRIFTPDDALIKFRLTQKYIYDIIESTQNKEIVVVTHHQPSRRSIADEFKFDTEMNGGYASNLDSFIERSNIKLWFCGHVHSSWDYMIGNTRILVNSRGYPRERTFNNYKLKYVEI